MPDRPVPWPALRRQALRVASWLHHAAPPGDDLSRSQQAALFRRLAGCCREAADSIESTATPTARWQELRGILLTVADLFETA